MRDTIYRDEAIALVNKLVCSTGNSDYDDGRETEREAIKESLIALPSADRPQGEWIFRGDGKAICSDCGKSYDWDFEAQYYNYCPECGAEVRSK